MRKPTYSPGVFSPATVIVGSAKPKPPAFVLRPRHVVRAVAVVVALIALYICGYEPAYRGTLVVRAPRPLMLVNREVGDETPANRLLAVDRALDAGMDGLSVDAELSPDGDLEVSLGGAYLAGFNAFVRSVKDRSLVLVNLKANESAGIEERAVQTIRRHDAHLSVVLGSVDPMVLYRVKQLDPLVRTAFIFSDRGGDPKVNASWALRQEFARRGVRKFVEFDLLSIDHQVDASVIDRLIAKGWPALIWAPSSEADIRHAVARRPYGVITSEPNLTRRLRSE
jgi:glycerophosphoryl diester phosphodiesterase